jgi:hypothetical protein
MGCCLGEECPCRPKACPSPRLGLLAQLEWKGLPGPLGRKPQEPQEPQGLPVQLERRQGLQRQGLLGPPERRQGLQAQQELPP